MDGCRAKIKAVGLCNAHYQKQVTYGSPASSKRPPDNRHEVGPDGSGRLIITRQCGTVVIASYDLADRELVGAYRWHANSKGYVSRKEHHVREDGSWRTVSVFLHLTLLGARRFDPRRGDHIDGDTLNNRRSNLRFLTPRDNVSHQRNINYRGASRFRNVQRDPSPKGGWIVVIQYKQKTFRRSGFSTEEEAAEGAVKLRRELGTPSGY